ncbi:MAG: small basic family protein [Clostridia bacterium]|nr:small basic family protein [Clostridia bacterium]
MYIIVGCLLGVGIGFLIPTIPYSVSNYLAIAIVASLDSVFGGIASNIKKVFDIKVFISGFFVNSILAILLTYLGQKLNVDIYLAAIIVFVGRMFNNLGIIRRYYLEKIDIKSDNKTTKD